MKDENNLNNNQGENNSVNTQVDDISIPILKTVEEPTQVIPTINNMENTNTIVFNDVVSTQNNADIMNSTIVNEQTNVISETNNSVISNSEVILESSLDNGASSIPVQDINNNDIPQIVNPTLESTMSSVQNINATSNIVGINSDVQLNVANSEEFVNSNNTEINQINNNLNVNTTMDSVNVNIQNNITGVPKKEKKKINKNLLIICSIVLGVLIFGIVLFLVLFGNSEKNNTNDIASLPTAFFISNKDNNYALFDVDGNRLTDFKFKGNSYIKNGSAKVEDNDGNYGIIASNGKMIVDFGKYEDIDQHDTLYEATDKEGNDYLLNSKGKVIMSLEDANLKTFITDSKYYYYILETDKEYMILNYNGEVITKFNIVEDAEEPGLSNEDPYIVVFYHDTNYLINLETNKLVTSYKENKLFCINDLSEDNNEILFNYCVGMFETKENNYFKYMKDNKIVFELNNSECSSLTFDDGNNILCHKDYDSFILDKTSGEEKFVVNDYLKQVAYIDSENYMLDNDETDKLDIYVDGKLKTSIDGIMQLREYVYQELYLVEYHKALLGNNEYRFYKKDGTLLNEEVYERADGFDKFGRAVVSKDFTNHFLIDINGNKVSNEYSSIIETYYEYYYARDKEGNETLIDLNGKELYSGEDIYLYNHKGTMYARIKKDEKYSLYNLDTNKLILTTDKTFEIYDVDYIQISNGESIKYYTFEGKMFYED